MCLKDAYILWIDHSIGTLMQLVYPYMVQPVGAISLFVANILFRNKYHKKYLFNPFVLLLVLFPQFVFYIFYLPSMPRSLFDVLWPLMKSPAYQIAVDALFIAYTLIALIKYINLCNSPHEK